METGPFQPDDKIPVEAEITLPRGSTELDIEAKRQIREAIAEALKAQRPNLRGQALVYAVDQAMAAYIEQINQDLEIRGGFHEEFDTITAAKATIIRDENVN